MRKTIANVTERNGQWWKADLLASFVVFLVALPLCMGIAIASGAPPVAGLLSGVIGGVVVGALGGNRMQVSGPANGLIVLVQLIIQQFGLAVLGIVVFAAGLVQLSAGLLRLGQIFRAIPPSIIHGLMTGFALIIFASQFHVMLDDPVPGGPLENMLRIPEAIWYAITDFDGSHRAAAIGALTIAILLFWKPLAPRFLASVPASLVAVATATALVALTGIAVDRVTLPDNLLQAVRFIDLTELPRLLDLSVLQLALTMAFLASTETLLSASAVDRLHDGPRTDYDRELAAQGVGNMLCGLVGAIPLTGVIIRSATNVQAGARTRLSSVLHGVWLLAFVVLLPGLLSLVPTASLAAVLVVAVVKLIDVKALRAIWKHDPWEIAIYFATAGTIFFWGVLEGVLLGIALAGVKLLTRVGKLKVRVIQSDVDRRVHLHLAGTAVFLTLPKLARTLESIPSDAELHVHIEELNLIDHACLDLLINWGTQMQKMGGTLLLDWESLRARFLPRKAGAAVETTRRRTTHKPDRLTGSHYRFFRQGWRYLGQTKSQAS